MAFSPDGKTLISGSGDKTIKIWQLASLPSVTSNITTTSSSVQPTQSQFSQSSFDMPVMPLKRVLWCYLLLLCIPLGFVSFVFGFVGGSLVSVIGIACCWRFYRWFWQVS
ncbi:MAG: hypothetical protein RMZ43_012000 [Nostoc sp. CmiVER01]|uniref:hypothetical protein n=1 Tax=Nostoc sp. CmiVER01 TaxID=3075384 RepID=UPI002AD47D9B|nr:hypothetical protein [Nostoc sp. CmiVER01]MDZ8121510.1 hypothetical protein [Nostoc sp. CmiVER01]